MKDLYHGSLEIVSKPEIRKPTRTLDYGSGFYTTTSVEQAEAWVRRKASESQSPIGFVSTYDLKEGFKERLDCLFFDKPNEAWVEFVMANRTQRGFDHGYDLVYGPVANDRVYAAFALYEGGVLSKRTLIDELKTYNLVDQCLFHTEKALAELEFLEAREVFL